MRNANLTPFPAASQAVDLMELASKAADLFLEQNGAEQRKLLHLVLQEASWKGGELRMCLREPFENLTLSNRASHRDDSGLNGSDPNFDNWRATVDTFRTFLGGEREEPHQFEQIQSFLNQPVKSTHPALVPSAHSVGIRFELPRNLTAAGRSPSRATGHQGVPRQKPRT